MTFPFSGSSLQKWKINYTFSINVANFFCYTFDIAALIISIVLTYNDGNSFYWRDSWFAAIEYLTLLTIQSIILYRNRWEIEEWRDTFINDTYIPRIELSLGGDGVHYLAGDYIF